MSASTDFKENRISTLLKQCADYKNELSRINKFISVDDRAKWLKVNYYTYRNRELERLLSDINKNCPQLDCVDNAREIVRQHAELKVQNEKLKAFIARAMQADLILKNESAWIAVAEKLLSTELSKKLGDT